MEIKRHINNGLWNAKALLMLALTCLLCWKTFAGKVPDVIRKDSLKNEKNGFRSLFSVASFNATRPYEVQLNPLAVPFVEGYMRSHKNYLERMKIWGKPYFDVYDAILLSYGLPKELKYLSVIESALVPGIVSSAGAVGPWQLMDFEAKRLGLKINSSIDERTNFYKSTHAASRLLKELHSQFNDWTLVIAAYNCGAGRVRQAIRRAGSRDFWRIQPYLPLETSNHVKRFIATHYICEGAAGLTTMTADELTNYKQASALQWLKDEAAGDSSLVEISGKYKAAVIARFLDITPGEFTRLNPNFDRMVTTGVPYKMKLPAGRIDAFVTKKNEILDASIVEFLR